MRQFIKRAVLLAVAVLVGGCTVNQPLRTGDDMLVIPEKMISVQQLAHRLGLTVDANTASLVTMHNAANHVMLMPDEGGQASVNDNWLTTPATFTRIESVNFVPVSLEGDIRAALAPAPAPQPPATPAPARAIRIVVDPGHGGKDFGAVSPKGFPEKSVTLTVAEELAGLLKAHGFDVALTRHDDDFVTLDERADTANRFGADLFVSIHADSHDGKDAEGFSVYTCQETQPESRAIAKAVAEALDNAGYEGGGAPREANYRLLICTQCPGIMVQLGYLCNGGRDAKMLADPSSQARMARAMADAITAYFKR